jgi:hypothetical protein
MEVVAASQRYVRSGDSAELDEFDLSALKKADYQLGERDVNAGWRKAIQDSIRDRENAPEIVEIKPSVFGVSIDVAELFRRVFKFFGK